MKDENLIPRHGGYRKLRSFRLAQLIYDVTVRFCDKYINRKSRTHDQMVQAARSGVQNIAEASKASGTSKKSELKLTNVARASLEELRLDYEDFLRQRGLELWPPAHPALKRFRERRCSALREVQMWVKAEIEGDTDKHGLTRTDTDNPASGSTVPPEQYVANAALSLLNVACHLLDRQLASQAKAFENEGGFTERLYRTRKRKRDGG